MMTNVIFTDHTNMNLNRLLKDIRCYSPLGKQQEQELIIEAQAGNKKAEDLLVKHNMAYVLSVAKQYVTPYVGIEDVFQSGAVGLIEAIYRINPYRNNRLITCATPYIRKEITDYLAQDKLVYIPDNHMRKVYRDEEEMYGVFYYDNEDTNPNWEREIVDNHIDLTDHEPSDEEIEECLLSLSRRNADIFRLLHGLDDGFEHAPEAVAFTYHCSRERVRQIDKEVMGHLKAALNPHSAA